MRLEVYCETGPVRDGVVAHGLSRALVPILIGVGGDTDSILVFPTTGRLSRGMLDPQFKGRVRILSWPVAKLVSVIGRRAPAWGMRLFDWYCRLALRPAKDDGFVFGVLGATFESLFRLQSVAAVRRLGFAVYLVDDLTEPERIRGREVADRTKAKIRQALQDAAAVYCISDALVQRVREAYGVEARKLRLPYVTAPFTAGEPDGGRLIYVGTMSFLYASAIRTIIDAVEELNRADPARPFHVVMTAAEDSVRRQLGDLPDLVRFKSYESREDLLSAIAGSRAALLPYSFDAEHRPMVESSFPSKTLDYLEAAQDIILHAPDYSSAARYFADEPAMSPLTTIEELKARILAPPDPGLCATYRRLLAARHSPASFRALVMEALPGGA